jgi:hypothetical protein
LKKLKSEAKVIFDADMSRIMVQKLPLSDVWYDTIVLTSLLDIWKKHKYTCCFLFFLRFDNRRRCARLDYQCPGEGTQSLLS